MSDEDDIKFKVTAEVKGQKEVDKLAGSVEDLESKGGDQRGSLFSFFKSFRKESDETKKSSESLGKVVGDELTSKTQSAASGLGGMGSMMSKMGPYGLIAAAGIGAFTGALGFAVNRVMKLRAELTELQGTDVTLGDARDAGNVETMLGMPKGSVEKYIKTLSADLEKLREIGGTQLGTAFKLNVDDSEMEALEKIIAGINEAEGPQRAGMIKIAEMSGLDGIRKLANTVKESGKTLREANAEYKEKFFTVKDLDKVEKLTDGIATMGKQWDAFLDQAAVDLVGIMGFEDAMEAAEAFKFVLEDMLQFIGDSAEGVNAIIEVATDAPSYIVEALKGNKDIESDLEEMLGGVSKRMVHEEKQRQAIFAESRKATAERADWSAMEAAGINMNEEPIYLTGGEFSDEEIEQKMAKYDADQDAAWRRYNGEEEIVLLPDLAKQQGQDRINTSNGTNSNGSSVTNEINLNFNGDVNDTGAVKKAVTESLEQVMRKSMRTGQ